jgi:hypothetical protein
MPLIFEVDNRTWSFSPNPAKTHSAFTMLMQGQVWHLGRLVDLKNYVKGQEVVQAGSRVQTQTT